MGRRLKSAGRSLPASAYNVPMRGQFLWLGGTSAALLFGWQTLSFEVASVKPHQERAGTPAAKRSGYTDPKLFSAHNTTLKGLILRAYDLQDYQVSGGPGWIETDRFDIDARSEQPATADEMKVMLRGLLAERFQLATHWENRNETSYVLSVANGGPKFGPYFHEIKQGEQFPPDEGRLQLGGPMKNFVFLLRRNMATFDPSSGPFVPAAEVPPILDQTGLTGEYSILVSLKSHETWPALLEHQLGLKLQLRKEEVRVLKVDRAARPSAN